MATPAAHSAAPSAAHAGTRLGARPSAAVGITTAALVVGVVLRVLLALVNLEANDPHLPVIRAIAFEHRFPGRDDEWEGFQPKLYHTTAALVWRALPTRDPHALTRAAQLVSCAAGILTLLVVLRLLRLLERSRARGVHTARTTGAGHGVASERAPPLGVPGAVAFAAVALNPALAGTSVQATNDAFVILFATLALYAGVRCLTDGRGRDFALLVLWAILAGVSKGNGLVAIVAVTVTFAAVALLAPGAVRRERAALRGAAFVALVVPTVALVGPYWSFQQKYGTPFVTNWTPSPRPALRYETFVERPGLTSILYGLFTFRLVDLLRHPESNYDRTHYPRHRTSLWSRVHAQAHSAHFEAWPPSWKARSPAVLQLTRALILLGLVPTALVAWGLAAMARDAAIGWRRDRRRRGDPAAEDDLARTWPATLLLLVAAAGYLAFVVVYSIRLRDYSSMKTIFVLPALPAFAAALAVGVARLLAWRDDAGPRGGTRARHPGRALVVRAVALALILLLAGYAADLGTLAAQLGEDRAAGVPPA